MRLLTLRKLGAAALIAVALMFGSGKAHALVIDLAFVLDRSGSVGGANYNTITQGLANSLNLLPVTGANQYRVGVYSFASDIRTVVGPTIVDANNLAGIQTAIATDSYSGGFTRLDLAIAQINSSWGPLGDLSLINISTDGEPFGTPTVVNDSFVQRNIALANGWDSISAEAIGFFNLNFLSNFVSPQPGFVTNDPNNLPNPLIQGFVLQIAGVADYEAAIAAKVQRVVDSTPVPEPMTIAMLGVGLLGIGFAARRRAAV